MTKCINFFDESIASDIANCFFAHYLPDSYITHEQFVSDMELLIKCENNEAIASLCCFLINEYNWDEQIVDANLYIIIKQVSLLAKEALRVSDCLV